MMNKILVIQTASIGDVILASPVLEKLHAYFPESDIDLLVKKGMEELFIGHPYLHQVLTWEKKTKSLVHYNRLIHQIRLTKYDLVVNLQRFLLTGLMTIFSRAGQKIGFDKNPVSFFFTRRIPHIIGDKKHEIERNLSLIEHLTGPGLVKPALYLTEYDSGAVAGYKSGPFYTISPASLWFTKQYPAEKWAELIREIPVNNQIYLLGSNADKSICETIIQQANHPGCHSLAGKLTFLQSAALMKDALMNFTNDSAPMHLASAVNAPVTAIYCSTIPGFGFGPLSDDSTVVEIQEQLDCRPCGLHGLPYCPRGHFNCANKIPVSLLMKRC